jgi:hypothetical protein
VEKFKKVKSFCGSCKSRYFLKNVFFYSFYAILIAVVKNMALNPQKIIQGTCLRPVLLKSDFWKGILWAM